MGRLEEIAAKWTKRTDLSPLPRMVKALRELDAAHETDRARLAEAERLLREAKVPYDQGIVIDAFLAAVPTEAPRCYDTSCRFFGQRHATAHEGIEAYRPEPPRRRGGARHPAELAKAQVEPPIQARHAFDDNGIDSECQCWWESLEHGRCGLPPGDPIHKESNDG